MGLLEELQNTDFPYSPTNVRDLIDSNRSKFGYVNKKSKRIIFYMMKRIVIRGALNYMNINKIRKNDDICYSLEDIVNEIFIVLDRCVDKFDTTKGNDFYLYFNSAVSRRVSRIANYKKVNNDEIKMTKYRSIISDDEGEEDRADDLLFQDHSYDGETIEMAFDEFRRIGLTDEQIKFCRALYEYRRIKDVVKKMGYTRSEYRRKRKEIKEILRPFYEKTSD